MSSRSCSYRDLHYFPTRRSSDLCVGLAGEDRAPTTIGMADAHRRLSGVDTDSVDVDAGQTTMRVRHRSEEHTSELQSRRDLVCRLLLEKKKNRNNITQTEGK